jgi:capsular polysaccharide biosynthesis protein
MRWLLVGVLTVLGGVAGYAATADLPPVYQATTTLIVGDLISSPDIHAADIDTSLTLSNAYGTLIRSETVLSPVIDDLGLHTSWTELRNRVHVSANVGGVPLITVTVSAETPRSALAIVRAVATQTVALAPSGTGGEDAGLGFGLTQVDELKGAIVKAERRLHQLEAERDATTSVGGRAALESRINEQTRLITDLQANYATFAQTMAANRPSNHVGVLETASVTPSPLRPHRTINSGLGAGIGLLIGVAITVRPRRSRMDVVGTMRAPSRGGGGRALSAESPPLPPEPGERVLDPWVRELAREEDRS